MAVSLSILVVFLLKISSNSSQKVVAAWFNDSWGYRQTINLTSSFSLNDYQVYFTINTATLISAGKMKSDCSDIRVTDNSGKLLPVWVDTGVTTLRCNQTTTKVWARGPSIPNSTFTLYFYYGNPSAVSVLSPSQVFIFFDDFETFSDWNTYSSGLVSQSGTTAPAFDGSYTAYKYNSGDPNGACKNLSSTFNFSDGYILEGKSWRNTNTGSNGDGVSLLDSNYNGYGETFSHTTGSELMQIDIRAAGVATTASPFVSLSVGPTLPMQTWFGFKLITKPSNNFELQYLNNVETYLTNNTANNASYSSFNQVCIMRGTDYFTDHLLIRRYSSTEPSLINTGAEEHSLAPVGWWKFDEGTGTTFNNAGIGGTLNGVAGVSTSAPSWADENNCISGKCLLFSGTKYLSIAHNSSITPTGNYTLSFWMRPESNNPSYVILKNGEYGVRWQGNVSGLNWYDNLNRTGTKTSWNLNQWYFITLTKSDGTMTGYVDGVIDLVGLGTAHTFVSAPLEVGRYSTENFGGKVDDLKVYNYARTPAQILADFNTNGAATSKGNAALLGTNRDNLLGGTGPIGYWNFNEGAGQTAYDTSGSGVNGAIATGTSSPTWSFGKIGKSLSFPNGVNSYVNVTNSLYKFAYNQPFTISLWAYKYAPSLSYAALFAQQSSTSGYFNYALQEDGANHMCANVGKYMVVGYGICDLSATVPLNMWNHYVQTYDGTNINLYINGRNIGSTIYPGGAATAPNSLAYIGNDSAATSSRSWNGLIDEVKVYNYARTPKQVVEDMNFGHPGTNSPYLYYKFDEGQGAVANNSGSCGSICNATFATGNSGPTWVTNGKFNKALSFSGFQSLSTAATIPASITNTNYTVSYWINTVNQGTTAGFPVEFLFGSPNLGITKGYTFYVTNTDLYGTWVSVGVGSSVMSDNRWQQITATYANSKDIRLYLNGVFLGGGTVPGPQNIGTKTFNMGGRSSAFINGLLDEVKVFNYPLSDSEILQDYNQGQALQLGSNSQNVGNTGSLDYCIPGDTTSCASPVAEWKFDEGVGSSGYDSSGNNLNAGFSGTPVWSTGKYGKSISLNGTNNSLIVADNNALDLTTTLTLEAWVKPTSFAAVGAIFDKGNAAYNVAIDTTGLVYYQKPGTNAIARSSTALVLNQWNHVAVSQNGAGTTAKVYINSTDSTVLITNITPAANASQLNIGAGQGLLNGSIDQARIYNYARTPAQISYDYNRGGPISWFKFDECQGNVVNDAANIGTTSTIVIGPGGNQTTVGSCNDTLGNLTAWYDGASGKYNAYLYFDGTDDYVTTGSTYPSIYTISLWLNPLSLGSTVTALNTSAYLNIASNGTVTAPGFSSPTIYVNGKTNTAVSANVWNNIVVSSGTAINATAISIAKLNTSYYSGKIDDYRLYNYPLNASQVASINNENSAVRFGPGDLPNLAIGMSYQGGIIAYVDNSGRHGLIAAPTDQAYYPASLAPWGCSGTTVGATGTAIGTGMSNTTKILAGCATAGIAARVARNYTGGGYTDWYLPSIDELGQLYANRIIIGNFDLTASGIYWSSTEYNSTDAWINVFFFYTQINYGKTNTIEVRAVRSF